MLVRAQILLGFGIVMLIAACTFDTSVSYEGADVQPGADAQPGGDDGCTPLVCGVDLCGVLNDGCGGTLECTECVCESFPAQDTCSGDEICVEEECTSAFGRSYTLTVDQLIVAATRPNGDTWDFFTDPDPYVEVFINDDRVLDTDLRFDTYQPSYDESVDIVIPAGSLLRMRARDSDLGTDQTIISCDFEPLTADDIGGQVLSCVGTGGTLGTTLSIRLVPL